MTKSNGPKSDHLPATAPTEFSLGATSSVAGPVAGVPTPAAHLPVRLVGALALLTQFVVVGWGLSVARPFLIPMLLAALLAFIATPLIRLFRRMHIPEVLALTLGIVVFAVPFGLVTYAVVREVQALVADWPAIIASFKQYLAHASQSEWALRLHLDDDLNFASIQDTFINRAGEGMQWALVGVAALMDASSTLFLIVMFAILMVATREQLYLGAERIIGGVAHRISASNLIGEVSSLIQSFLVARFLIVVVVAALAALILLGFHVHYALLLGALLGLSTLIPNIGFILGMIPSLVVGFATGHGLGNMALLFVFFMGLALFEANLLTPKLVGGKLNINSLAAFVGLFAGGLLWGVWGMLLSIPLLGIVRICLSLSTNTRPWAELLAEREDANLLSRLLRPRAVEPTAADGA